MSKISYPAIFNDVDLTSVPGLTVLRTDPYKPPKRNVSMSNLARTSNSKVNSGFYTERFIAVRIEISRSTRELTEQSLDTLMGILQAKDKALILNQSSTRRKYYATFSDAIIESTTEGGSYLQMDLIFACSDKFGYDLGPTTLLSITTPFTSANRSDALIFNGSAEWQAPVISITYSAITGGTTKSVVIGNGSTGQQVTITRTWTAGDTITINPLDETAPVRVNNTPVDFSGAILLWNKGIGYWYYNDTFTTRSFTGLITVVNRYV